MPFYASVGMPAVRNLCSPDSPGSSVDNHNLQRRSQSHFLHFAAWVVFFIFQDIIHFQYITWWSFDKKHVVSKVSQRESS
jgi:hypothetical protein